MFDINYDDDNIELIDDVKLYDPRGTNKKCFVPINLSIEELDQFCLYLVTITADSITHAALLNMRTMFEIIDQKPYRTNDSAKARFEFIKLGLEARIDLRLVSKTLIKQHIERNCDSRLKQVIETEIFPKLAYQKMPNDTCKYINTIVYENLINSWSLIYSKQLSDLMDKKSSGQYNRISDFSKDLKNLMSNMDSDMRRSEEYQLAGKGFDLTEENIEEKVKSIWSNLSAPTNKLKTGLQYLNKMLNGGFESGRSYLFMGISGVGKSIILLSCALWAKQYNSLPIQDDKKQAVLFISQENSDDETFERIFNINVTGEDIRNYEPTQIVEYMKKSGVISKRYDKSKIDFIFRYYNDQEIGVSDIDTLIDDFDREGIQIIMVVQDYIEKLRPKFQYNELRHSLGSVATELAELAKSRKIPVLTAAQLNRSASSIVSDAVANNKTNTIKLLGKQNVSESWDMIKNSDAVIIINREVDDTQEGSPQYLGFKLEKFRGRPNKDKIFMFLHPFDEENQILLTPDIDGKPLSRLTMEEFNPLSNRRVVSIKTKTDLEAENNTDKFLDYCSSITDEYEDSTDTLIDVCRDADKIIKCREAELKEKQLEKENREALKVISKDELTPEGYFIIVRTKPRPILG